MMLSFSISFWLSWWRNNKLSASVSRNAVGRHSLTRLDRRTTSIYLCVCVWFFGWFEKKKICYCLFQHWTFFLFRLHSVCCHEKKTTHIWSAFSCMLRVNFVLVAMWCAQTLMIRLLYLCRNRRNWIWVKNWVACYTTLYLIVLMSSNILRFVEEFLSIPLLCRWMHNSPFIFPPLE